MPIVKATREGLIGGKTSSGALVDLVIPFVALPCVAALHQWIEITAIGGLWACRAIVLDVGPWNTQDAAYVFGSARPQAEGGVDRTGRPTNGAGIDLGEEVWRQLRLTDNGLVSWEFCAPARLDRGEQLLADQVRKRLAVFDRNRSPRRRSSQAPPTGPTAP